MSAEAPEMVWTTLSHHIDLDFLMEAYRLTRKDGAAGVDGQTASAYAEHLEENLQDLLDRFKSGTYKAPPVRRTYIMRYADDAVMVFYSKSDAERVLAVLPKRFGRSDLTLHPDKTKLVKFTRPGPGGKGGKFHPGSFDFLGFTHHWGGAGCVNRARPDLGGTGESDFPRLPDIEKQVVFKICLLDFLLVCFQITAHPIGHFVYQIIDHAGDAGGTSQERDVLGGCH